MTVTKWQKRVDSGDWDAIAAEVNDFGGALLPRLLTKSETDTLRGLYPEDHLFRATIDMRRHRFGEGEYRYFERPYPRPIEQLKQALYPRLLPIARDWWTKLGRRPPWPDTLDDWLDMCHKAGQTKSTAILLKYGEGDWNALHRDLYGDLVFPLQSRRQPQRAGRGSHRRRIFARRAAPACPVARHRDPSAPRPWVCVHHSGAPRRVDPRLVGIPSAPRCFGRTVRPASHPRPGVPRRQLVRLTPTQNDHVVDRSRAARTCCTRRSRRALNPAAVT